MGVTDTVSITPSKASTGGTPIEAPWAKPGAGWGWQQDTVK